MASRSKRRKARRNRLAAVGGAWGGTHVRDDRLTPVTGGARRVLAAPLELPTDRPPQPGFAAGLAVGSTGVGALAAASASPVAGAVLGALCAALLGLAAVEGRR